MKRNELLARIEEETDANLSDYAGVYEVSDLSFAITVQVVSGGRVQVSGTEEGRAFTLDNARIEGALLSGTKIYQDGTTEKFEGVFMTRTVRNSPTDIGVTAFGLGVVFQTPFESNGIMWERLFYQRR